MDKNSADSNSASQQHYARAALELGQRLRERRTILNRPIDELVVALRSSAHQLHAIEAGKTEVFYGRSYYESLLYRYAEALGIPKGDAAQMLRPPMTPVEAEPQTPQAQLQEQQGLNESRGATGRPKPFVWGFAAVAGIGLAVVAVLVVLSLPESGTPEPARPAAPIAAQPTPRPPTPPAGSSAGETPAEQPQGAAAAAGAAAPTPAPVGASAIAPVVAPAVTPAVTPTPAPVVAPTAPPLPRASGPALVITAGDTATWYWVRKANEDVEQKGLAPGQSVSFDELPQYLVLNDPARLRVVVQGRDMPVKSNDETGRNIARLGRSALQAAAAQPASSR